MGKKRIHRLVAPETRPIPQEDLLGGPKAKKNKKKKEKHVTRVLQEESKALQAAPRLQRPAQALNAPDHVVASLWSGPGSEDAATKAQRKAIGVVVRGGASSQCPAPLEANTAWGDARLLQPLWRRAGAKLNDAPFTPVQRQAWPAALGGLDLLAVAPTGSGKTLAYVLPAVARLRKESSVAVALAPTRELAKQVLSAVKRALRGGDETAVLVAGGAGATSRPEQVDALRRAHFVVATPGRLADLASSNLAPRLADATVLILDEADRMLQLGFEAQLDAIAGSIPGKRQTLLFTATFPGKLRDAAARWVRALTVTMRVNAQRGAELEATRAPEPAPVVEAAGSAADAVPAPPPVADVEAADADFEAADAAPAPPRPTTTLASVPPNVVQRVHVCATHKRPRLLLRFLERVKKIATGRQQERVLIFSNTTQACSEVAGHRAAREAAPGGPRPELARLQGGQDADLVRDGRRGPRVARPRFEHHRQLGLPAHPRDLHAPRGPRGPRRRGRGGAFALHAELCADSPGAGRAAGRGVARGRPPTTRDRDQAHGEGGEGRGARQQ